MVEYEIRIRSPKDEPAFIYSIFRGGLLIETAVVSLTEADGEEDTVAPGYYGGSQVVD